MRKCVGLRAITWICLAFLYMARVAAADLELDEYLQRANAARDRGDWESVASQTAQAVNHADLPKSGAQRSAVHLEYGRAMGVLCQYGEAEKYLQLASEIAVKAGSSLVPALYELGAVSVAQKKFSNAVQYFAQLDALIAGEPRGRLPALLVADAYEKFALALVATGKGEEAELRRRVAANAREASSKAPPGTITPYGAKCS